MAEKMNKIDRIEYWVDNREISASHFNYFLQKIRLKECDQLTPENIDGAYKKAFDELFELSKIRSIKKDVFNISFAKSYLMDRYGYLRSLN